jgi:Flp pilus assembly protein TadG
MNPFPKLSKFLSSQLRAFRAAREGNVILLFSLTLIPMLLFVGAALDYTRAAADQVALQGAVDATALSLAREPPGTPLAAMQTKANVLFAGNYQGDPLALGPLVLTINGEQLNLSASKSLPTSLMTLAGMSSLTVGAKTQVAFVTMKLEVAMALDNTGSMGQNGKMAALKSASNALVTTLQQATSGPNVVKISVVPFNTQVNIGTSYASASWLRYDTTIENPNFFGSSRTPPNSFSWAGCLTDRDQSYDIVGDAPASAASNYVAANCEFPGLATTLQLSNNFNTINSTINGMQPNGATNITIGLTTALATLNRANPLGSAGAPPAETQRFLVLFSDGSNTENRFLGTGYDGNPDGLQVDARMRLACDAARTQPIQIFTVVLNAPDSNNVMRDCATTLSNYYNVTDTSQLQPVFNQIAKVIINMSIRLAK